MEAWLLLSLAAAFFQNLRNSLQKSINTVLSTSGAAYTRFLFGLPLAIVYWIILRYYDPQPLNWGAQFFAFSIVGGVAQVIAMWLLLRSFHLKSFAVGTAYSKTETLQTALFTIIILGEAITGVTFIAILISFVGVCLLSLAKFSFDPKELLFSWTQKGPLMGLGNGVLLGLSAVSYRGASLSLDSDNLILSASATLFVALTIQVLVMTIYLYFYEKGQIKLVWKYKLRGSLVGLLGMLGSVGWFTAMALQNAAYVRAVGQVELIFTFLTSVIVFKEKVTVNEVFGTVLIVGGILVLLFG